MGGVTGVCSGLLFQSASDSPAETPLDRTPLWGGPQRNRFGRGFKETGGANSPPGEMRFASHAGFFASARLLGRGLKETGSGAALRNPAGRTARRGRMRFASHAGFLPQRACWGAALRKPAVQTTRRGKCGSHPAQAFLPQRACWGADVYKRQDEAISLEGETTGENLLEKHEHGKAKQGAQGIVQGRNAEAQAGAASDTGKAGRPARKASQRGSAGWTDGEISAEGKAPEGTCLKSMNMEGKAGRTERRPT